MASTTTNETAAPAAASDVASSGDSDAAFAARMIEKTKNDPRFMRGQALLKEKRLEEAVVVYEDLLRTMIEIESQSDSLAVAPVYYQYGHSMLLLAEATASVFGGAVAVPNNDDDTNGDNNNTNNDAEQDAKNMADDLEVAWEMLEVARVIYSRYPNELAVEQELARVYMRLGDLGMESDVFDQAKSDYEKSLVLRQKILKQTNDCDTTLLADLYCCLAISCIYHDAKADDAGVDGADADSDKDDKRNDDGLRYYVLAGHVMAENIHRVAAACSKELQAFVAARIPPYTSVETEAPRGKGKAKQQQATGTKQELLFLAEHMDTMRDAFVACAHVSHAVAGGGSSAAAVAKDATTGLTTDEAQLLEYLEIYVELKEKVDGINESARVDEEEDQKNERGKRRAADAMDDAPVTTIGFGNAPAAATTTTTIGFGAATADAEEIAVTTAAAPAAPVNVIAVKKRKVAPATAET